MLNFHPFFEIESIYEMSQYLFKPCFQKNAINPQSTTQIIAFFSRKFVWEQNLEQNGFCISIVHSEIQLNGRRTKPCLTMAVMLSFKSSRNLLSRSASLFDIPCAINCFSNARLALRTFQPRVKYVHERLRDKRARCGVDFNAAKTKSVSLISTSPTIEERRSYSPSFSE